LEFLSHAFLFTARKSKNVSDFFPKYLILLRGKCPNLIIIWGSPDKFQIRAVDPKMTGKIKSKKVGIVGQTGMVLTYQT
jgi:hypothetical protein